MKSLIERRKQTTAEYKKKQLKMGSKRRNDIIFSDLESTRILNLLNKKATATFENLRLHSNKIAEYAKDEYRTHARPRNYWTMVNKNRTSHSFFIYKTTREKDKEKE